MISTAWDYAIFCQMYLNNGVYDGRSILSEDNPSSGFASLVTASIEVPD